MWGVSPVSANTHFLIIFDMVIKYEQCLLHPSNPTNVSPAVGLGALLFLAVAYPLQCCVDRHSNILVDKAGESSRECKGRWPQS